MVFLAEIMVTMENDGSVSQRSFQNMICVSPIPIKPQHYINTHFKTNLHFKKHLCCWYDNIWSTNQPGSWISKTEFCITNLTFIYAILKDMKYSRNTDKIRPEAAWNKLSPSYTPNNSIKICVFMINKVTIKSSVWIWFARESDDYP